MAANVEYSEGKFIADGQGIVAFKTEGETAYVMNDNTSSHTSNALTATSVATTASTNTSPFGYSQSQADAIVAAVNALIVDVANLKQVVHALVTDLQSYALVG